MVTFSPFPIMFSALTSTVKKLTSFNMTIVTMLLLVNSDWYEDVALWYTLYPMTGGVNEFSGIYQQQKNIIML